MFTLNCKGKITAFDSPGVMGIINITPDSFYKGYLAESPEAVITLADRMINDGAMILDIGGQSSRPGSARVSADEEWKRIAPTIESIRKKYPHILLSIDTYHSSVAEQAVKEGADIINDISGGEMDDRMIDTIARIGVPFICMHMKGKPENMQSMAHYTDITQEVIDYFAIKINAFHQAGLKDVIIDPGFGFAKNSRHNFRLMHDLPIFQMFGKPVLAGISRKSTVYKTLGISSNEALNGTTVMHTIALQQGADILRVHDVKEAMEAVALVSAYEKIASGGSDLN